nr:MAG TPA: glutaredoxin-like protein [Caudoviricetes sp.]
MNKVTVYTKKNCPQCMMTKEYMDALNIEYETIDVTDNDEAREHVKELGFTSLPVVVVEDGEAWFGFRPDNIDLLK